MDADHRMDDNSVDSEEEVHRQEYGLYLLKRLIQIKRSQDNRMRLETMLRAFYRWSYEFPLAQKCDEMAKQLRERNLMMDTVRSAYLRDVVAVKHHLDKINNAKVDEENPSLVKLQQGMYDLHTLPSVDLRDLVDNVRASVGKTSAQLRESLVDAGLLDPETLRTLNPWDQSRGYRRIMRIKKGGAVKPPDLEGESISLAAPSNKKLFVRYCKDCIGLAIFIKDWNREVELSMKFKADFANVDALIQEYRQVIEKLNNTIEGQERQIVQLLDRTSKLETANAWFEKWGVIKEAGKVGKGGILDEYEQKMMYKHIAEMARAEIESFAFNSAMRIEVKEQAHIAAERAHRQRLREAELTKDADSKERLRIVQDFRKTQLDLQTKVNEIAELTQANQVKEAEKAHLNQKLTVAEAENVNLHSVIDKKEVEYATLRDESNAKIEDLNYTIRQLNNDYSKQENTIDELRDNLANKKAVIQDQISEISDLKHRIRELEAMIPPPKPRFRLKTVAIAVRYLMRLYRMLRHKDYEGMGKLGYTELLRRQDKYVKMLTNANERLRQQVFQLTQSYHFQHEELLSFRSVIKEKNVELQHQEEIKVELKRTKSLLRHTEQEKQEAIALGESNIEAQNIIINQRVHGALEVQHGHHLQQAKIYAQIQRNLSHHLAQSLFRVRAVVAAFEIDSEIPILEKPYEAVIPPLGADGTPMPRSPSGKGPQDILFSRQKSMKSLLVGLQGKSRRLAAWVKKNRSKGVLLPKRVPVVLFREPRPGEDGEMMRKERAKSLSVMTHVIQEDFKHVEEVRKLVDADIRRVQDYVLALKNKHNELLLQVKLLEEELREERMPSQTSRTNRKRIGDIKSSFSHLMRSTDSNHQNSYFSNVLSAIETVQAEHGEMYKEKLIKSGKFKLTEIAKEIVRRNSAKEVPNLSATQWERTERSSKSVKVGASTRSSRGGESVKADSGPASRGPSFAAGGYPMNKLPSVVELEHEYEAVEGGAGPGQGMLKMPSLRKMASTTTSYAALDVPHTVPEQAEEHQAEEAAQLSLRSHQAPAVTNAAAGAPASNMSDRSPRAAGGILGPVATVAPLLHQSSDNDIGFPSRDSSMRNDSGDTPGQSGTKSAHFADQVASALQQPSTAQHINRVRSTEDNLDEPAGMALDGEGSLCNYESDRVAPADPPAPPQHKVSVAEPGAEHFDHHAGQHYQQGQQEQEHEQAEDTVGFESDSDNGEPEEEEFDEDILYMEDLLAAKDEMRGLLSREEVIQNRIRQAEEDKEYLEAQVKTLEMRLEKKKQEFVQLEQNMYVATGEQKQLKVVVQDLTHENELLKEIVEEDYRFHSAHMKKALEEKEITVIDRLQRRIETANQGTQVSCAVCAIREEGERLGTVAPKRYHGAYDEATVAMVNEQFTKPLNGEVVLIAKPRRINRKSIRTNQESPTVDASAASNAPPVPKGFEELFREPPTREELMQAARPILGSAFDTLPVKRRDPSPTPPGMGFSELLMKHLESSSQLQRDHTANAPYFTQSGGVQNKPASAGRSGPTQAPAEGSKFSRIKKMPPKSSTSSNDLHNTAPVASSTGSKVRPSSANLAILKKNQEQRTESHTAAYIQNKLMVGYGSTPQIAPYSSEPYVPLHTVDLASAQPEPTAAYLARALQAKGRAASAGAARIEHTSSAELLPAVQENGSQAGTQAGSQGSAAQTAKVAAAARSQLDLQVRMPTLRWGDGVAQRALLAEATDDLSDLGVEFL